MNQCVPSWNFKETPLSVRHHGSKSNSSTDVPIWDYGVEELTWNTGHSLGLLHVAEKQATNKYTLEKPSIERGTLASIVDQATTCLHQNPTLDNCGGNKVGPKVVVPTLVTTTNALVPSQTSNSITKHAQVPSLSTHCSTRVESCSGVPDTDTNTYVNTMTHTGIDTGLDHSVSNSATWGRDSYQVTFDTSEKELGTTGFTSPSMGSPENNSPALKKWKKISNKHDLGSPVEISDEEEKKKGKYSSSNKRGRAAAVHNQSERKRRDKINQRMKTLQKMIPNSNKTDKASMLDEVIEYLKQLQTEIQMMRGITNMGSMMLPMGMQQQLQMSMMSPMGMGMGIGMGMPGMTMAGMGGIDMNMLVGRSNLSGMSPVFHPGPYMQMSSWNGTADRLPTPVSTIHDSLSSFFACQSQPMTMDAYSRMASLYQQFQQQSDPNSKN